MSEDRGPAFAGQVFRRTEPLVSREIAGETVLVPVRGKLADLQQIFMLNPVGRFVWDQLDGHHPAGEILDGLTAEYACTREQAAADLAVFFDQLQQAGLAEPAVNEHGGAHGS